MSSTTRIAVGSWVVVALAILCGPASAGSQVPDSSMELVFAGSAVNRVGDQLAVPVECLGDAGGFCSGVLTLSRGGRHTSATFSVRGGSRDSLFVASPTARAGGKVHGVATTAERVGAPISRATYLYAR